MHDANLRRPFSHARNESHQASLICMRRITAYGMHLSPNVIALPVKIHIVTTRTKALDLPSWRAIRLVADEEHIMPCITEHSFEYAHWSTCRCQR
ncbi:hypothetical protein J2W71_002229 [Pseudomonas sp. 3400]|nr:hypothetical protein [Pseudomonas sp. 3400]MDR7012338.1 hypothetical protein [Pseudomonas alcaliphila]